MKRKDFLRTLAAAAAGIGALPALAQAAREKRQLGAWMGGRRTPEEWQARFHRLAGEGFTMVLPAASADVLREIVPLAHAEGLAVHAWQTMMWSFEPLQQHPEWYAVNRNGVSTAVKPPYVDYYRFLCPNRPEVQAFVRAHVRSIAQVPALDSVHLDYIRFPDVILPVALWPKYGLVQDRELPEFDYCYCDVCAARFRQQSGRDPRELPDPTADAEWRRFRWDSITRMVAACYEEAHAAGTQVTAAVFPTPEIARALVRQDWVNWRIDQLMPMIYHGFYNQPVEWIGQAVREGVRALEGRVPLNAGLYLPDLTPAQLRQGAELAFAAGASGVVCFNEAGLTDEHLRALRGLQ